MFADKTVAEPASLTITEAVTALSNGQLKILDLLRSCQDRIQRFNNRFRAFSHLASFSTAEIDALQAEFRRGKARSPLHGLTIGVKGSIPVASLPWTEGSAIFANRIATTDAAIVSRARQAGAIILGTTTLSELAMYGVCNAFEPMGINPWCPKRKAGGSSTGAGVAACTATTIEGPCCLFRAQTATQSVRRNGGRSVSSSYGTVQKIARTVHLSRNLSPAGRASNWHIKCLHASKFVHVHILDPYWTLTPLKVLSY